MSECEYMVVYLDEMVDTVDYALQSETEAAQRKWLRAQNMGEKVCKYILFEAKLKARNPKESTPLNNIR